MTTVTFDLDLPGSQPVAYRTILVQLVAGTEGGAAGPTVIGDTRPVKLDEDGQGEIDLVRNDEISPSGTYYRLTVAASSPTLVRCIRLESDTTVAWTDEAIQVVEAPVGASYVPSPTGAPDGYTLTIDGEQYVLGPAGTGASLPAVATVPVTPVADTGTTDVTITEIVVDDNGDPISGSYAYAVDVGGPVVRQAGTVEWERHISTNALTGRLVYTTFASLVPGGPNRQLSYVVADQKIASVFSARPAVVQTDDPTELDDATNLRHVTRAAGDPTGVAGPWAGGGAFLWINGVDQESNFYSTPEVSELTDGVEICFGAAPMSDRGLSDCFAELFTQYRTDYLADLDGMELAFFWSDGVPYLFWEYCQIGDPLVEAGEFAAGRLNTQTVGFSLPIGRVFHGRLTVVNDDGDGHGVVTMWRQVAFPADGDETAHGRTYRKIVEKVLPDPTSIAASGLDWNIGLDKGDTALEYLEVYDGVGGALVASPRGSDATSALGDVTDGQGNVWVRHGDAYASDARPESLPPGGGGGVTEGQMDTAIAAAVTALVDGAPGALDTLNELAAALGDDASFATRLPTRSALASDLPFTSSSLGDLTGVSIACIAGKTYVIHGRVPVTGGATGDFKVAFGGSGGLAGTLNVTGWAPGNSVSSLPANVMDQGVLFDTLGVSVGNFGLVAASTTTLLLDGWFTCTTSGTLTLQGAQRTTDAGTPTVFKAGSHLIWHTA